MKKTWQLMHRREVGGVELGRFEVSFPTLDAQGSPVKVAEYLKLEAAVQGTRRTVFLHRIAQRTVKSDVIYVSSETATEIPEGTEVTVTSASVESFRWYVLRHSESLKLALYGLILAVAGLVMGTILTVAEVAGMDLGLPTVVTLKVISAVVEFVGLALVFWKGLLAAT